MSHRSNSSTWFAGSCIFFAACLAPPTFDESDASSPSQSSGLNEGDSSGATEGTGTTSETGDIDPIHIWIADDATKVGKSQANTAVKNRANPGIWSPGNPVRLTALRDETVAFQVIVQSNEDSLYGITVELAELVNAQGEALSNASDAAESFRGRWIEHFVEHYYDINRASGGPWGSFGGTGAGVYKDGRFPDALIPVEVAPSWAPYPMQVEPGEHAAIWIDITIPGDLPAGTYYGQVVVRVGGIEQKSIPVEIEVGQAQLPLFPVDASVGYDVGVLGRRMGWTHQAAAERHLLQLLRRHHLQPILKATAAEQLERLRAALVGQLYSPDLGYQGPGQDHGDRFLQLGSRLELEGVDPAALADIEQLITTVTADRQLAHVQLHAQLSPTQDCGAPGFAAWRNALDSSTIPGVSELALRWNCGMATSGYRANLVELNSIDYHIADAMAAKADGRAVWLANPRSPHVGAMLSDHMTVGPLANGWIQAHWQVDHIHQWDISYWYDFLQTTDLDQSAKDPFFQAETLQNRFGEYRQGGGVLVYPGRQVDHFTEHSLNFDGLIASMRLKVWRRGIQDAGYYILAAAVDPGPTRALAEELVPRCLDQSSSLDLPAWSDDPASYLHARRQLWQLIEGHPPK